MTARNFKKIFAIAFVLAFCSLSGLGALASEKGEALSVDDVQVVGNRVVVTVTNLSEAPQSGQVSVTAIIGGVVPSRSSQTIKVGGSQTVQIPVDFMASVSDVIVVGIIVDGAEPVQ
jgi:hypothetical protein